MKYLKSTLSIAILSLLYSCESSQQVAQAGQIAGQVAQLPGINTLPGAKQVGNVLSVLNGTGVLNSGVSLSQSQIGEGLKQALLQGITNQVSTLTQSGGFYKNDLVKILLPPELKKVDSTLRQIGLSSLADKGLQSINTAAELAVKEATPIFVDAIKSITFQDALTLLQGGPNAATNFLKQKTEAALYPKFYTQVKSSIGKAGADQIWGTLISNYNNVPLVTKTVNPDLSDYITKQALNGVFTMIAKEEANIRANPAQRATELMKAVFALQDKK